MLKRILIYCLGIFIMAIGVVLAAMSNLGNSPPNSLPYVLSLLTDISMGNWVTMMFITFIGIQVVLLRKDFKPINFLQILFATLFGYFVTLSEHLLHWLVIPDIYLAKLGVLFVSIVVSSLGVSLYLSADFLPLPPDGLVLAIMEKCKKFQFGTLKIMTDSAIVIVASICSLVLCGSLEGIREGTIIAALTMGKMIEISNKVLFKKGR